MLEEHTRGPFLIQMFPPVALQEQYRCVPVNAVAISGLDLCRIARIWLNRAQDIGWLYL